MIFTLASVAAFALGQHRGLEAHPKALALVVGVNKSVDPELETLAYADDDAAGYYELLRSVGVDSVLLARFDDNTRRVHQAAAAVAKAPTQENWAAAVSELLAKVNAAGPGAALTVYVVFAGHGNVKGSEGYLALEDARLTAPQLTEQLFSHLSSHQVHFIVDACQSSFLAVGRGPGGERRAVTGFTVAAIPEHVGLLLSTGSFRESHEWEGFQAGVFSHEVRSGLRGAADVDGDQLVSYREMAAFVEQANRTVDNEKYRPDVYARAPSSGSTLFDLSGGQGNRLVIDPPHAGHYSLEDARGVRLADFHHDVGQAIELLLPAEGPVFLRQANTSVEYEVPAAGTVRWSMLTVNHSRVSSRGAAHLAFSQLFKAPFSRLDAERYQFSTAQLVTDQGQTRKWLAAASFSLAAVGLGVGLGCTLRDQTVRAQASADESQLARAARNGELRNLYVGSVVGFVSAGVLAALGAGLVLWPDGGVLVVASDGAGTTVTLGGRF